VFVLVARRVLSRGRAGEMASAARLPLEDGAACDKETIR
jgi:cbb3-type cytochrome oxidase subunit 3